MGELLLELRPDPRRDSPRTLTGLDAVVHHPNNRWSGADPSHGCAAAALIVDRTTWAAGDVSAYAQRLTRQPAW